MRGGDGGGGDRGDSVFELLRDTEGKSLHRQRMSFVCTVETCTVCGMWQKVMIARILREVTINIKR